MNILFLDKKYDAEENDWMSPYFSRLAQREQGHMGRVVRVLNELKEIYSESLSNYNVAIAHPEESDVDELREEMRRRSDFRVLLFGGNGLDEKRGDSSPIIELGSHGQCVYEENLTKKTIDSFLGIDL